MLIFDTCFSLKVGPGKRVHLSTVKPSAKPLLHLVGTKSVGQASTEVSLVQLATSTAPP